MDITPQQDTRPLLGPQGSASTLANSRMPPDWPCGTKGPKAIFGESRPMASKTLSINRAPVQTLWATVVAERLGFERDEALTLGRAVAAVWRGRRLSHGRQRPPFFISECHDGPNHGQHDDEKGSQGSEEQREQPPRQADPPFRPCQAGVEKGKRTPADRALSLLLHLRPLSW
jgi:hypothetical protein